MCESDLYDKSNPDAFKNLTSFIDDTEVGMYISDFFTCEILFVNKKMTHFSGRHDSKSLLGKCCWSLVDDKNNDRCSFCPYEKLIDSNGMPTPPYTWELYFKPNDTWLKVTNEAVFWTDGRLAQKVIFYDITEMKKMQEKLTYQVFTDRLLHSKNELSLEYDIEQANPKPSLIIFDIISFHIINEVYGRHVGDRMLLSIRDWITEKKHDSMELYRLGGDEFCITVNSNDLSQIKAFAYDLYHRFSEPWLINHSFSSANIFCGVSMAVIQGSYVNESEPLLNLIQRTLKTAKAIKPILIYDKRADEDYRISLMFEYAIKKSIWDNMNGFEVYYQPIADTVHGTWNNLEASCRWNSPDLGLVSPEIFMSDTGQLGLVGKIGLWVLEASVKDCHTWELDKHNDFILHVSTSPFLLLDDTFEERIITILKKYNYPHNKLCLGITEDANFAFSEQFISAITRLRQHNILVALDGFGAGHTNFFNLKKIPVDILKVKRSFVDDIENDVYQQYLMHVTCKLAHTANLKLIAEGVETEVQKDILTKKGVDHLQGFYFSKPLSRSDMEKQLFRFKPAM